MYRSLLVIMLVNASTGLVTITCQNVILSVPVLFRSNQTTDFANSSNKKKKVKGEKQTDVGVKDRKACGVSPWKHCEPVSLSPVLVHVIILKAFSWQRL